MKNRTLKIKPEVILEAVQVLKERRIGKGLSQGLVAKLMDTSQKSLCRIEGARVVPHMVTLEKYAKALGTKIQVTVEIVEESN